MTARERAVACVSSNQVLMDEEVIEALESAGLAIVDRELFEALVAAVRGAGWAQGFPAVAPDDISASVAAILRASSAMDRAIALLNERGE